MNNLNDKLKNTCKIGQKAKCCRYLVAAAEGFECAKLTEVKAEIDSRVKQGLFTAKGDNCLGIDNDKSKTILN